MATKFVCVVSSMMLAVGGTAVAVEPSSSSPKTSHAAETTTKVGGTPRADEALAQLMAGNERFDQGKLQHPRRSPEDFQSVAKAQYPIAAIVACADSRVSPELLFDAGVGDVFVIRVAGNVVDGAGVTVKGSLEYAVAELHVPLIVVLGHSNCGAVKAAIAHIDERDSLPGSINGLVELIKPAVVRARGERGDMLANATRENVSFGVEKLKTLQPILAPSVTSGNVKIVGGIYDLDSGQVTLLQPKAK